jgi:hypothetical protein
MTALRSLAALPLLVPLGLAALLQAGGRALERPVDRAIRRIAP